ncbi:hypothetical protein PV369_15175, partial [Streptomyces scabiei]|nr:hypothetical protein [Streptomyces scabiei]
VLGRMPEAKTASSGRRAGEVRPEEAVFASGIRPRTWTQAPANTRPDALTEARPKIRAEHDQAFGDDSGRQGPGGVGRLAGGGPPRLSEGGRVCGRPSGGLSGVNLNLALDGALVAAGSGARGGPDRTLAGRPGRAPPTPRPHPGRRRAFMRRTRRTGGLAPASPWS